MNDRDQNSIKHYRRPEFDRAKAEALHDEGSGKASDSRGANRGLPHGHPAGCYAAFQRLPRAVLPKAIKRRHFDASQLANSVRCSPSSRSKTQQGNDCWCGLVPTHNLNSLSESFLLLLEINYKDTSLRSLYCINLKSWSINELGTIASNLIKLSYYFILLKKIDYF